MTRFLLVCLGGAIGSGARYLTSLGAAAAFGVAFPYGTLIVNIAGSFLLAALMQFATTTDLMTPEVRLMLTTGVMGGFTTYSSFNYETTSYFRAGAWTTGTVNIIVTLVGCLVAGVLGMMVARWMIAR